MRTNSSLGLALGGGHTLSCDLARQTGQSGAPYLGVPCGLTRPLRQRVLNSQGGIAAAAEPSTGSKDIITFQAEFGDWRTMVIGGADLGTVAAGRNTHFVLVECEQDVPFSEELLRIANGGTPVILVRKVH